jgi:hypothetical protein
MGAVYTVYFNLNRIDGKAYAGYTKHTAGERFVQ